MSQKYVYLILCSCISPMVQYWYWRVLKVELLLNFFKLFF